jgi:beta-glucosidase-like glycosyl hydrolase
MEPNSSQRFIALLTELVNEGRVPMTRIDDAVTRILRVKFAMGLMNKNRSPTCRSRIASKLRLNQPSRSRLANVCANR